MRSFNVDIHLIHCPGIKAICIMNQLREGKVGTRSYQMPLIELLEETREFKSTLASDKIYGILNLTKGYESFDVDYGTESAVVFQRLAEKHLIERNSTDILYHCVLPAHPSELDLPSWVPDWTSPGHVEPFIRRGLLAHATLSSVPKLHLSQDSKVLHITGKRLDKIAVVEETRPIPSVTDQRVAEAGKGFQTPEQKVEARSEAFKERSRRWHQGIIDIVFPSREFEPEMLEQLWRTFMCNRTRDNAVPEGTCQVGFDIEMAAVFSGRTATRVLVEKKEQNQREREEGVEGVLSDEVCGEAVERFRGANAKWCYNRRFFMTEAGRLGWTVDGARVGDEICVLYGGAYPFVLRPDGDGRHTIVGDSYTHGLMEGEAMDESFLECEFAIK